jgi:dinuclear metal center YbgI/SA1388 family protein
MHYISDVARYLEEFAPSTLAAEWDNVGLLVGDASRPLQRVMTCLTITPATVEEAIRNGAELIVVHHPLPFQSLKRITADTYSGRLLLRLMSASIAIYSPHTAFDSAADGINQHLALMLRLIEPQPLIPAHNNALVGGVGRFGRLVHPLPFEQFAKHVKIALNAPLLQLVGTQDRLVSSVAVACGSAGSLLKEALQQGCDAFVTGETNLHTCYEAEASNLGLILAGHFATERFHLDYLASVLQGQFPNLQAWSSREERDPLWYMG